MGFEQRARLEEARYAVRRGGLSLGYRQGEAGAPSLEDARSAGHWVARRGVREGRRTCSLGRAVGAVSRVGRSVDGRRQAMEKDAVGRVGDGGDGGGRQCMQYAGRDGQRRVLAEAGASSQRRCETLSRQQQSQGQRR